MAEDNKKNKAEQGTDASSAIEAAYALKSKQLRDASYRGRLHQSLVKWRTEWRLDEFSADLVAIVIEYLCLASLSSQWLANEIVCLSTELQPDEAQLLDKLDMGCLSRHWAKISADERRAIDEATHVSSQQYRDSLVGLGRMIVLAQFQLCPAMFDLLFVQYGQAGNLSCWVQVKEHELGSVFVLTAEFDGVTLVHCLNQGRGRTFPERVARHSHECCTRSSNSDRLAKVGTKIYETWTDKHESMVERRTGLVDGVGWTDAVQVALYDTVSGLVDDGVMGFSHKRMPTGGGADFTTRACQVLLVRGGWRVPEIVLFLVLWGSAQDSEYTDAQLTTLFPERTGATANAVPD